MEVLSRIAALKMETQICRPEASLGHASLPGTGCSLPHSCVMSRAEWPWRAQTGTRVGGGAGGTSTHWFSQHPLPHLGEDQQNRASSAVFLSGFFSLPPEAADVFGCAIKTVPMPCEKACIPSNVSLHTYRLGSKTLKDRHHGTQGRALKRLRSPGPTVLCCLILDKLNALSQLVPIFHKQSLQWMVSLSSGILWGSWGSWQGLTGRDQEATSSDTLRRARAMDPTGADAYVCLLCLEPHP